ncbi:putative inorganic phosphate cotransporter [Musca domestica]|uniref:Inorganic phosphate cotransporter n=1 Tax=Musca domestica TaxID=7370 RepID=A0ABM3UR04_MUSDO|nr:putative inorganic phosphate cotransporter [Musca domestica]XP_058975966.1 putative inorganic phosphate cotransporter [Musca domestica]
MLMRYIQALLLFIAMVSTYFSRVNIGVAVVAMTNANTTNPNFPEFKWNEREISYILSSFYWGFFVTQLPGGVLCRRFGAKLVMGLAIFFSGLLSVITPWCLNWGGWQSLCVIRVLLGLAQGMVMPCIFDHLAKWSPLEERNRLGGFSQSGYDCGMVLAMGLSGVIAESCIGWPGISYISAGLCFVWFLLWQVLGANNPNDSSLISESEKFYITSSNAHEDTFNEGTISVPWKAIFTSVPFMALLITRSAEMWGLTTLESQIPSYFHGVLNLEIKTNAFFSALPFMASWLMSYVFMFMADVLQERKIVSLTVSRKIFNSVAFWIPALGLIAIGFLDEDNQNMALFLITLSNAINSGETIGSSLNVIDLSPTHAGLLYSIINTVASVVALLSPLAVGFIVTDVHNRYQWQVVFVIAAGIFIVGNLLYIIFGTAETQSWNSDDYLPSDDTDNEWHSYKSNFSDLETMPSHQPQVDYQNNKI